MIPDRQDHIDAMEAAADVGGFEIVENIRRQLDLNICSLCRGPCSYETAWRLLWRDTLLHVCKPCADNRCELESGARMSAARATTVGANKIRSIKYEGGRWLP